MREGTEGEREGTEGEREGMEGDKEEQRGRVMGECWREERDCRLVFLSEETAAFRGAEEMAASCSDSPGSLGTP